MLARAAEAGLISRSDTEAAMAEPVPGVRRAFPALAPLLAARLMRAHPGALRIETTIDPRLQRRAEDLASRAVRGAGRRLSAAVLRFLQDPAAAAALVPRFTEIHRSLRRDASARAADVIETLIDRR